MLIAIYLVLINVVLPHSTDFLAEILNIIMPCFIIFFGIVLLFGVVGINISNKLGFTVIGGFIKAIGYICTSIINLIKWIIIGIFRIIPKVFLGSRRYFAKKGCNGLARNILAGIVTAIVIAVII